MNSNTRKAIQRRLDAGLKEFAIGEKFYFAERACLMSVYRDDTNGFYDAEGPMIEGVIVNGRFDPDNIFTPEEKASLAARRAEKHREAHS